jgi:hypothetical protein
MINPGNEDDAETKEKCEIGRPEIDKTTPQILN